MTKNVMKYKTYINEMKNLDFIERVDIDAAKKLLKDKCVKMDFDVPLWRGMRDSGDYLVMDGSKVARQSRDGNNLHTIAFKDTFKGTKLPMRDNSIVAIGNEGHLIASGYSENLYAIFPFDDVTLGFVRDTDILWIDNDEYDVDLDAINRTLSKVFSIDQNKKLKDLEELKQVLSKYKGFDFDSVDYNRDNSHFYKTVDEDISSLDVVNGDTLLKMILKYYNPRDFNLGIDTKRNPKYIDSEYEMWFSGKCIAIKESLWRKMKEEGFEIK